MRKKKANIIRKKYIKMYLRQKNKTFGCHMFRGKNSKKQKSLFFPFLKLF